MPTLNTKTLSKEAMDFLTALLRVRCNLLVSGELRVDKKPVLGYLESLIPADRQILRLEMSDGLAEKTEDWIELAAAAQPDYVIVLHWEKKHFLDLLRLLRSAEGIVAAIHATRARGALEALDLLAAQEAPHIPLSTVRGHVSAGLSFVIHCAKLDDTISIERITEVQGMEQDVIVMQDIFQAMTVEGRLVLGPTGIHPRLLPILEERGMLPTTIFPRGRRF